MFVKAPFTDQQVARMNAYQEMGIYHPYTCPRRDPETHKVYYGDLGTLFATRMGWICRDCPYVQETVHDYILEDDFHHTMHHEYNERMEQALQEGRIY
jgi:hypothetical protein